MKINREKLLEGLRIAAKVAESKSSNMPILSTVLIDGPGQKICATNLEIFMEQPIEIEDFNKEIVKDAPDEDLLKGLTKAQLISLNDDYNIIPEGVDDKLRVGEIRDIISSRLEAFSSKHIEEQFCLSAKRLLKIVESLDTEVVEISSKVNTGLWGNELVAIGDHFQNMPTLPADEFPISVDSGDKKAEVHTVTISRDNLADALLAVCRDASEGYSISNILLAENKAVATDSHRLHMLPAIVQGDENSFMLPAAAARLLLSITPKHNDDEDKTPYDIILTCKGNNAGLEVGSIMLIIRAGEGRFPNYNAVMITPEHEISVKKSDIMPILERAKLVSNENYNGMKVTFNGRLDIEAINPDAGDYVHQGAVDCIGEIPDPVTVGLNIGYFADMLKSAGKDEDISIGITDAESPLIFKHSEGRFTGLLMPMRV